MQPVQLQDFDEYLGKYVGDSSLLALLLDYDGTLSPIAPHPDLATLPPETRAVLERLARLPDVFIAVVSGRGVNNVRDMVGIQGITYAGNHGLEIIHPDGTKVGLDVMYCMYFVCVCNNSTASTNLKLVYNY